MKKHRMPDMKENGVNVTPLIDIVMCLIIFFMLVTKIGVSRGEDKEIELPATVMGKPIEDLGNTLTLNIHPTVVEQPLVTALVNDKVREIKIIDHVGGRVDPQLQRILEEFEKTHPAKARIIIRGDKDLQYKQLEQVLIAIANARISDVAYETKEVQ
ncbi:MAG TPA: biopolymer transporter ExbD [Humisphaera sp.]|jgi:biopolymer transport protein ExbD|nr:biopolymer transporter ExbD [Humisphaera sp.]